MFQTIVSLSSPGCSSSSGAKPAKPSARSVSNTSSAARRSGSASVTSAPRAASWARRGSSTAVTSDSTGRSIRRRLHATRIPARPAGTTGSSASGGASTDSGSRASRPASGAEQRAPHRRPCARSGRRPRARPTGRTASSAAGIRPGDGRRPTTLQNDAGLRMLDARSDPSANGSIPVATATAAPPLLPPGRARRVVRVAGRAEHPVERLRAGAELGRVGLADDDRSRPPQAFDEQAVGVRDVLGEDRRAIRGAHPGRVLEVLDRERQAVQRSQRLAARDRLVGGQRRPRARLPRRG